MCDEERKKRLEEIRQSHAECAESQAKEKEEDRIECPGCKTEKFLLSEIDRLRAERDETRREFDSVHAARVRHMNERDAALAQVKQLRETILKDSGHDPRFCECLLCEALAATAPAKRDESWEETADPCTHWKGLPCGDCGEGT